MGKSVWIILALVLAGAVISTTGCASKKIMRDCQKLGLGYYECKPR